MLAGALVVLIWLFGYVVLAFVDAALKGAPNPPSESEESRQIGRYWLRLLVAWIAIYVLDATPNGPLFWLLTAGLGAPGIWWPVLMLKLGADRAAALAGF